MNSIDVRTEKANAMLRYRSFQTMTNLFRFIEICVFLVVISTFCSQIPFTVRVSVDYLTGISFAGVSPRFVFVIGNVIILILLYKSRVADNGDLYGRIDVYDECVKRCERKICRSQSEKMMRVECNDSQRHRKLMRAVTERRMLKDFELCGGEKPSPEICRSQSEKIMTECNDSLTHRKLTSSVTERGILKNFECCGGEKPSPEICRSQLEKMMSVESHRNLTSSVTERRKILKNFECCGGEKPSPEIYRSPSEKVKPSPEICRSQSEKVMSVESDRKLTRSATERRILKNFDCCGGEKLSPEISRSQSEKMMRVECNDGQSYRNLRRSVTEREILKNDDCYGGERPAPERCGVEELSSEAFRRTVEAFIARQQQSLRDEELAPVPYVGA